VVVVVDILGLASHSFVRSFVPTVVPQRPTTHKPKSRMNFQPFSSFRANGASLLIDPSTALHHLPILRNKGLTLIVLDMILHHLMKHGQIKEWDHGVGMMLRMEIRLPQQPANEPIRLNATRVVKLVVRKVTVSMFSITEEVNWAVSNDAGRDPPEE